MTDIPNDACETCTEIVRTARAERDSALNQVADIANILGVDMADVEIHLDELLDTTERDALRAEVRQWKATERDAREVADTYREHAQAMCTARDEAQAWAEWFAAERDWIVASFVDDLDATYRWQIDAKATVERVRALADDYSTGPYPLFAREIRRALDGES